MMIEVDGVAIGTACRRIRASTGQLPEVLAGKVGVSSGTWRRMEAARKRLRIHAEFAQRVIELHNRHCAKQHLSISDFKPHPKI